MKNLACSICSHQVLSCHLLLFPNPVKMGVPARLRGVLVEQSPVRARLMARLMERGSLREVNPGELRSEYWLGYLLKYW